MPATNGTYSNNETIIYNALKKEGLNDAAICGVLANIYAESGFNPKNLQDSYENSLGNDDAYTEKVDKSDNSSEFAGDNAGYGICQWTSTSRKINLYTHIKKTKKKSIGDLESQIDFMIKELKGTTYRTTVWQVLRDKTQNTAAGAYNAGYAFCTHYEKPAGLPATAESRGNSARDTFWNSYSKGSTGDTQEVANKGNTIVEKARSILKMEPTPIYKHNGNIYNTPGATKGTDDAGLVYYSYREAGVDIPECTALGYYDEYKNTARKVEVSEIAAGDLLFYPSSTNSSAVSYVAIATGDGKRIYADSSSLSIKEDEKIGTPLYILRILDTSQTSSSTGDSGLSDEELSSGYYAALSVVNPYSQLIANNLSEVRATYTDNSIANNYYGYLIDMTHGGEFLFYIPEFTEQAGAQWSGVEIRGRSVSVQSYVSTNSRVISISLDLYAGVGLYTPLAGETATENISRLHRDAYFVKSLEYPDYTSVITRPPATVHLILGSAVNIVGVVGDVSVEHMKPLDSQGRSMYLKLSFTVTQTAENPPDYTDIRRERNAVAETAYIDTIQ